MRQMKLINIYNDKIHYCESESLGSHLCDYVINVFKIQVEVILLPILLFTHYSHKHSFIQELVLLLVKKYLVGASHTCATVYVHATK